jgi:hypothetical protein
VHRLAGERGERLAQVGIMSGGQVSRGEREEVVGRDADAVDELMAGAELARGRQGEQAAVVE